MYPNSQRDRKYHDNRAIHTGPISLVLYRRWQMHEIRQDIQKGSLSMSNYQIKRHNFDNLEQTRGDQILKYVMSSRTYLQHVVFMYLLSLAFKGISLSKKSDPTSWIFITQRTLRLGRHVFCLTNGLQDFSCGRIYSEIILVWTSQRTQQSQN